MTTKSTQSQLSKNDASFIENIFNLCRPISGLKNDDPTRAALAKLVTDSKQSLNQIVQKNIIQDRTGWKEAIGNLTKITGYSFTDLGITDEAILQKVSNFGNTHRTSILTDWDAAWSEAQKTVFVEEPIG